MMRVFIDSDTGTVTLPEKTKVLKGVWDGNFSANIVIEKKTDVALSWTHVDTVTASEINAKSTTRKTNAFRYENSTAVNWRFRHGSGNLSNETGAFGAEVYNQ